MKKLLSVLVLGLGLTLISHTQVYGASADSTEDSNLSQVEVNVNGDYIAMDVHPIQEENRLFVPIRTLASLGLSYAWNPKTRITTIQNKNGDYLKIEVNSSTAYKNEKPVKMDAPAKNKGGRVLVPIRFVSESLGYRVQYETIRKIVFISSSDYTFDVSRLEQDDLQDARKAAISLPITSSFKTLPFSTYKDHSYYFPAGKVTTYLFNDGHTTSVVQIRDGKANLVGQFVTNDQGVVTHAAGTVVENTDPSLAPYPNNYVQFYKFDLGADIMVNTYYVEEMVTKMASTNQVKVYSDIIQDLPNNK